MLEETLRRLQAVLRADADDMLWEDRDRLLFASDLADPSQALGVAAGLAQGERLMAQRHGRSLVDHRVWLVATAADLAGGAALEAAAAASALRLERLAVILPIEPSSGSMLAAFAALGWSVRRASCGNSVTAALSAALRSRRPTLIACQGAATRAAGAPGDEEPAQPGEARRATPRRAWLRRLARHGGRAEFERVIAGRLPVRWHDTQAQPGAIVPQGVASAATAPVVRTVLARAAGMLGEGCSLSCTPASGDAQVLALEPAVTGRPQAMGALLSGLALHGGVLPVGLAGLEELDHLLPSLRMAALQGLRVVHALTEPRARDGLDGRRAALRALPNLLLFRPADAFEATECADLALRRTGGPSVLLVSEAPVPLLSDRPSRIHAARGGYLLRDPGTGRQATLLASGPEVALALAAAMALSRDGVRVAVVSLPCWSLFAQQDPAWRAVVLGDAPVIAIERGSGFGWSRWLGQDGLFLDPDASPVAAGAGLTEAGALEAETVHVIRRFLRKRDNPAERLENVRRAG